MQFGELREKFRVRDQAHLFAFWDRLSAQQQDALLEQTERLSESLDQLIGEQKRANPFLRADDPAVAEAVSRATGERVQPGVATFAALRALKDRD